MEDASHSSQLAPDCGDGPEFRLGEGRISGALSLFFGLLSLGAVLCIRYPGWLSIPEARARYDIELLRSILFVVLCVASLMAIVSALLDLRGRLWIAGLASTVAAIALGGSEASTQTPGESPLPIGLDVFVLDLLVSALIFIPLERIWSRRRQRVFRREWSTDLSYFAMTHLLVQLVILVTTVFATQHLTGFVIPATSALLSAPPLWLQFVLALFVADFFQYWSHRAYHLVPWLWRFHAVHHSAETMDWLAGSRMHLLEVLVTRICVFVPLFVLGFSPDALYLYVGWVGFHAVFVHANLRWRFGWLRYVITTPQYHHWHHAQDEAFVDANYAVHLPILDLIFGTFRLPDAWPESYGTLGKPLPKGLLAQHAYPFEKSE